MIDKRLSMNILPSEVRLQPLPRDGYSWRYKDVKHNLFAKSLSELSTNTYIQLQKALERGEIWAVEADQESTFIFRDEVEKLKQDLRLSHIRQADLEKHNLELQKALHNLAKSASAANTVLLC
ncbi:uncharacterized protein BP01DRAFT_361546 [Aspergillus saccharolyticus JOP 1030-1]|uniref:Uncharacterized protein n=1 Tax=Aspergillus saccharolyticus JOP 1030-1 TaxID=1450539 RepID=A0A318Z1B0_9EURO|nr:hypothetical protein BP01DRAFT_361546 [Aspergillus saccharolyticus JOP 1030-1]PYH40077.1 hypothetical protein BP01DRAFT_361546 [Aspergillus saccharolyticus JOP 1030-1]